MKLLSFLSVLVVSLSMMGCGNSDKVAVNEDEFKKMVVEKLPNTKFKEIRKLSDTIFEGVTDKNELVYITADAKYVMIGDLIGLDDKKNETLFKRSILEKIDFKQLNLTHAIKMVKGTGGDASRTIAVFADPQCPFCKKLEKELELLTDVTVYFFPFPLPTHKGSLELAVSAWCADDRLAAWSNMMLNDVPPEPKNCDSPVFANLDTASYLNITSTPTVFFADGRRVSAALTAEQLEVFLHEVKLGMMK